MSLVRSSKKILLIVIATALFASCNGDGGSSSSGGAGNDNPSNTSPQASFGADAAEEIANQTPEVRRGSIGILLLARPTAQSELRKLESGRVALTYMAHYEQSSYTAANIQNTFFTGSIVFPASQSTFMSDVEMPLTHVDLIDNDASKLMTLDGNELEQVLKKSAHGILITVLITRDGSAAPAISLETKVKHPAGDDKPLVSMRTLYPNPAKALEDAPELLKTNLKSIASPTEKFHAELVQIVSKAKTITKPHLYALIDSCYYTFFETQKMNERYESLSKVGGSSKETKKELHDLQERIRTAKSLGSYTNQIVDLGVQKLEKPSAREIYELLHTLFPLGGAENAFKRFLELAKPLSAKEKLEMAKFAMSKEEDRAAVALLADYFEKDSKRTVNELQSLVAGFEYYTKDELILACLRHIAQLSTDQLLSILKASYAQKSEIAQMGMEKIKNLSPEDLLKIASTFEYYEKDEILKKGLKRVGKLTTAQLLALANISYGTKSEILSDEMLSVSDLSASSALSMAKALEYYEKDALIKKFLATRKSLTSAEVASFANVAYATKAEIINDNIDKISDLNHDNALKLAGKLEYYEKDTFLKKYVAKQRKISSAQLIALASVAYGVKGDLINDNVAKISDLNTANALKIAASIDYYEKDTFLLAAVDRIPNLTAEDILRLSAASYGQKDEITAKGLKRLDKKRR